MGRDRPLGEMEHLVMLAVLQLGEEAYGLKVIRILEERTGRAVAQGSVYTTLNRLEERGYLSSYAGDPLPVRGGRTRRHYRVESSGREALHEARHALREMWRGLDPQAELP